MGDTFTYFLATGGQTGGAFSLVDEQAKRGETIPRHRHEGDAESFYVLDGEIGSSSAMGREFWRERERSFTYLAVRFTVSASSRRWLVT